MVKFIRFDLVGFMLILSPIPLNLLNKFSDFFDFFVNLHTTPKVLRYSTVPLSTARLNASNAPLPGMVYRPAVGDCCPAEAGKM